MRNTPVLGPYGDKKKWNNSVDYSFNCRDVMSPELIRRYQNINVVERSMDIKFPEKNKEQEVK